MRAIVVLALMLTACASEVASEPAPPSAASEAAQPSVPTSTDPGVDIAAICAETTYVGCSESLTIAADVFSGELVAVCEYPDGTGDVVTVPTEADAEAECSADGLIEGSRVVQVLQLP